MTRALGQAPGREAREARGGRFHPFLIYIYIYNVEFWSSVFRIVRVMRGAREAA